MRNILIVCVSAFVAVVPLPGVDPAMAQDEAPFDVVRLGDGALTCEALVAEIRGYNAELQTMQQQMTVASNDISREAMEAATRRPMGGGVAMGLGSLAAGLVPGGSMVMGAVQAAGAASTQASARNRQQAMTDRIASMTADTARMGPLSGRVAHLSEIARSKSC